MKIKNLIKVICFMAIFVYIGLWSTKIMGISNIYSEHAEMMVNGYYALEEDSADVVFIGNSHVYRYWQNAFAWKEYGIAAATFSTSDMPYSIVKNVAIEALKTQTPKVLVLDITSFMKDNVDEANNKIYLLLNNMKFSSNYMDTIKNFCAYNNVTGKDMVQYYLPLVQFHDRWSEISEQDFKQTQQSYLNSCYEEDFLSIAISGQTHEYKPDTVEVEKEPLDALDDLCEWCKELDCEVIFYAAPTVKSAWNQSKLNTVVYHARDLGFEVINCNEPEWYERFGFDEEKDFQDPNHTNIIGSYKFTKVFGKFLKDKYNLPSHKGETGYEEWDEQSEKYYSLVDEYVWPAPEPESEPETQAGEIIDNSDD